MTTETKRTKRPLTLGHCIDRIRAIEANAESDRRLAVARAAERAGERFDARVNERKWALVNQLPASDRHTAIAVLKLEPLADGVPTSSESLGTSDPTDEDDGPIGESLGGTADGPDSFGGEDYPSDEPVPSARIMAPVPDLPPGSVTVIEDKPANERKTGSARR